MEPINAHCSVTTNYPKAADAANPTNISTVAQRSLEPQNNKFEETFDAEKRNIKLLDLSGGDLDCFQKNVVEVKKLIPFLALESKWSDLEKSLNLIYPSEWDQGLWASALLSSIFRRSFKIMIKRVNVCPDKWRDMYEWNLAAAVICHLNKDYNLAKKYEERAGKFTESKEYQQIVQDRDTYLLRPESATESYFNVIGISLTEMYDPNARMKGIIRFDSGDYYEGELKNNKPHGQGKSIIKGVLHEGEFVHGKMKGIGRISTKDGAVYQGQIVDYLPHGKGYYKYANGERYAGNFAAGEKHGYGELTRASGDYYKGFFSKDNYHGEGVLNYKSGNVYKGQFKEGRLSGRGEIKLANGFKIIGVFDNDQIVGMGLSIDNKGKRSVGKFIGHQFEITTDPGLIEATVKRIQKLNELIIDHYFKIGYWAMLNEYLEGIDKIDWTAIVWERAFLLYTFEKNKSKLEALYKDCPKNMRSGAACSLALAFLKLEEKDYQSASGFLNRARSEHGLLSQFKDLEEKIISSKQASEEPAASVIRTSIPLASEAETLRVSSKNKRKKQREKAKEKVEVKVLSVEKQKEEDHSLILTVKDDTDVHSIINDLCKRFPINLEEECTNGSHNKLIFSVDKERFVILFATLHGNKTQYSPKEARKIGKALGRLQIAGEKKFHENDKISAEGLKPFEIVQMAMRSHRGAAKVARFAHKVKDLFK